MFCIDKRCREINIINHQPQYIGEVLIGTYFNSFANVDFPVHELKNASGIHKRFIKFTKNDVKEGHDGFIKIFNFWNKRENVFYYDAVYNPLRAKIEKENKNADSN